MNRKTPIGIVAIVLMLTGAALALTLKTQQTRTWNIKIEDFPIAYENKEPVKITGLHLGRQRIAGDFQAGDDWLNSMRFTVKNVSDQPIREVVLWLDLSLKDARLSDSDPDILRIEIKYGRDYWTRRDPDPGVPEIVIQPGQEVAFTYNSNYADSYVKLADQIHYPLPSNGHIALGAVVFDNADQGWTSTRYVVRNTPDTWSVDPARRHLNGNGGEKNRRQATPDGARGFMPKGRIIPVCYNTPTSGDISTQQVCSPCSNCKYLRPNLVRSDFGFPRQLMSAICYHTVLGVIDSNDRCKLADESICSQPNVYGLNFASGC